ncbi:oxidoreductase [Radicibacter daui]|uniref:oxidoreductase n=1 Tax=Radicibacter daui TaxID=3064829 RepID=UPI004046C093
MSEIGVALVGYGLAGRVFHAPLLSATPGLRLRTIISSRPAEVQADHPAVAIVPDLETVLADAAIDLVVIASPNTAHFPQAEAALKAGKHVVVDKPLTPTVAEAEALISLAARQNRHLGVFHNARWHGDFLTLRHLIAEDTFGDITLFEGFFDRFVPGVRERWREQFLPGSGTFFDLGAHLIDQTLCLFGPPEALWADLQPQREGALADDYFHLTLAYGKSRVILRGSSLVREPPGQRRRFSVHGNKASFLKDGIDPQQSQLEAGLRPGHAGWGYEPPENWGRLIGGDGEEHRIETRPGSYETYYAEVRDALLGHGPLPVPGEAGLEVIRVIEAALGSSQSGRRVRCS